MITFEPEQSRIVYSSHPAGVALPPPTLLRVLELLRETGQLRALSETFSLEDQTADFLKRSLASDGVLGYLAPADVPMRDFLRTDDRSEAKLIGVGFFGTTTGLIHDLSFDYDQIDGLTAATDLRADRYLLENLLQDRSNRQIMALAKRTDRSRAELFEAVGLKPQQVIGDAVVFGREALPISYPTIANAPKHCDPVAPTDEYIINELREIVSEGSGFKVDPRIAELAFGRAYALIGDAKENGSSDTLTRETAYDVFSNFLIGKDWPMGRDIAEEGQFDEFLATLQEAHRQKLREIEG